MNGLGYIDTQNGVVSKDITIEMNNAYHNPEELRKKI